MRSGPRLDRIAPDHQRLVLFLSYYADLGYDRIAAALGIRSGTVGAALSQAYTALRRFLEEAHP